MKKNGIMEKHKDNASEKEATDVEKSDSYTNKVFWKSVEKSKCELEGPYECPGCGGHIMLDATYLDQVSLMAKCPYCGKYVYTRKV